MMKMLVTLIKKENKKQASLPALVAGVGGEWSSFPPHVLL